MNWVILVWAGLARFMFCWVGFCRFAKGSGQLSWVGSACIVFVWVGLALVVMGSIEM